MQDVELHVERFRRRSLLSLNSSSPQSPNRYLVSDGNVVLRHNGKCWTNKINQESRYRARPEFRSSCETATIRVDQILSRI